MGDAHPEGCRQTYIPLTFTAQYTLHKVKNKMSGAPELHYFDFDRGGRAFALRAAFHAVKQEYKDVRFQFPEFQEMKKQGKYVAGLPILKLPSGKEVTQSAAILRYIGKMGGLYPADLETALICDSAIDTVQDIMAKTPGHDDANEKKRLREELSVTLHRLILVVPTIFDPSMTTTSIN